MNPLVKAGIAKLFRMAVQSRGGSGAKEMGILLKNAKAGSTKAYGILQERLSGIGVQLKNKKDLAIEVLDDAINYADDFIQKITGGGMDAPLKKGGVVKGLDSGTHKRVRLI